MKCSLVFPHAYGSLSSAQVFLKEKERKLLQDTHHKEVMRHIVILQRWFRTCLIRLHFLQKRDATMIIQVPFIFILLTVYPYHITAWGWMDPIPADTRGLNRLGALL